MKPDAGTDFCGLTLLEWSKLVPFSSNVRFTP
jgi:hypothetical protein